MLYAFAFVLSIFLIAFAAKELWKAIMLFADVKRVAPKRVADPYASYASLQVESGRNDRLASVGERLYNAGFALLGMAIVVFVASSGDIAAKVFTILVLALGVVLVAGGAVISVVHGLRQFA